MCGCEWQEPGHLPCPTHLVKQRKMHLNRFSFKLQALMKIDFWHSLKCDIILILGVVQDMLTDAAAKMND